MSQRLLSSVAWGARVALLLSLVALAGCSTSKVDWNSRIGVLTFDQAVVELGPPDKDATLTDGSRVAEWLLRRGHTGSYGTVYAPGPYYRRPYGYGWYGPMAYYDPGSPDYWIRLTFGPDARLTAWKKLAR